MHIAKDKSLFLGKTFMSMILLSCAYLSGAQDTDTINFSVSVIENMLFTSDPYWRGGDGASSIDLGDGRVLWLFSDSFVAKDSTLSRAESTFIRNSIGLQQGYDPLQSGMRFYWNSSRRGPQGFFRTAKKSWHWPGDGVRIGDRLLIFLMNVRNAQGGLGFEVFGWSAVLIFNPDVEPQDWRMRYIKGTETYGLIAGSAEVSKDDWYIYASGAVEPDSHEAYVLRWNIEDAYNGDLRHPEWYLQDHWTPRTSAQPVPEPLFIGATEYSMYYDTTVHRLFQVQAFGFGEAFIGIRSTDSLRDSWSDVQVLYTPSCDDVADPIVYAARAHPEQQCEGMCITFNINSLNTSELLNNPEIYYPRLLVIRPIATMDHR